jgi:hypothetical protein
MSRPIMNLRTPEIELPVVAEIQAEVSRRAQPEQGGAPASEERTQPRACNALRAESFRFDDPYWDEVFDSYHNPTLRTCCRF